MAGELTCSGHRSSLSLRKSFTCYKVVSTPSTSSLDADDEGGSVYVRYPTVSMGKVMVISITT